MDATPRIHFAELRGGALMRVTAVMGEPVAYLGDLMHVDGIVAAAAYRDLPERTRRRVPPLSCEWPVDLRIPLSRWFVSVSEARGRLSKMTRDGHALWGWCGSAEIGDPWLRRGKIEIRKRPPVEEMRRYAQDATVQLGAGPLKAYDMAVPTVFAHRISWMAHGDAGEVRRLLSRYIPAIGKKRNLGCGTVLEWVVEEVPGSVMDSVVAGSGARALPIRRLPAECGLRGARRRGSIRAPYHHASRDCDCVEPQC